MRKIVVVVNYNGGDACHRVTLCTVCTYYVFFIAVYTVLFNIYIYIYEYIMGICNIDVVVISRKHFLMRSIGLSGVPVRWKAFGLWAIAKIYFCRDYIRS